MYILSQGIGNYHQTIKIGPNESHLEIRMGSTIIYNDIATNIIDTGETIKWTTPSGEKKEIRKYSSYTYA